MQSASGFDPDRIELPRLDVREWQGLVFAAVDGTAAAPFEALVEGIEARLGPGRDLSGYGGHRHAAWEIACNWKVYVDNFLEGYHVPHVHPALNRMLDYRSYRTELAPWSALQWSPLESDPGLYGDGDALYWWLWPNTMLNVLPGRLQTNRVVPLGVDRCRVEFDTYYAPGHEHSAEADLAFSDEVQQEDVGICEAVQRGLASGSYATGPLNPLRETALAHFHALLRGACAA
jgi:choline monooxygenase